MTTLLGRFVAAGFGAILIGSAAASPFAAAGPTGSIHAAGTAEIGITKTASVATLRPGEEVEYKLVASCSSLVEDCVNFTVTDVLPADLEVTALPPSNSVRDVTYDAGTRTLTVAYKVPISGGVGLLAGSSQTLAIGMRLPTETPVSNGAVIDNTAAVAADNASPASASADVTTEIPVLERPVATKSWSPASALAQSGATSTITVGARNASTNSAHVRELAVADTTSTVFDRFDLASAGRVTRFPAGADRVVVDVCTKPIGSPCVGGEWVSSSPQSGAVPLTLALPGSVSAGDVTGIRYRFSASGGTDLPYDADDAPIAFDVTLRDRLRSTGVDINPTTAQSVQNCASPSLTNAAAASTTGAPACAPFTINPSSAATVATKSLFSDANGDWAADGTVVVGQNSGVSMKITGSNASAFPVPIMRIDEPSASSPGEFSKLDITKARITFPSGATEATLTVTCRSGADPAPRVFTAPPTVVSVNALGCADGVYPATVSVQFKGEAPGTLDPLIAPKAVAALELHGAASGVDASDVGNGLLNCADAFIASNPDSTGSATSTACSTLAVQNPSPGVGGGTKSSNGVQTIVPGQPLDFTLSFRNSGNIPVSNVVLVDPPDPTASNNPFNVVQLSALRAVTASPASRLEVYDPNVSGYVAYNASDAALLLRAKGIRVTVLGNLAVGQTFQAAYTVLLRAGQPNGVSFKNCASIGIGTPTSSPFCNGSNVTSENPSSGASLNKIITPATVLRPQVGLADQVITVKHRLQNTGTLYLKRLQMTDVDADFFDAITFVGNLAVNFPKGANRVQVDVCTSVAACAARTFVNGVPTSSSTPSIPVGVVAADVMGLRVTFTNSSGGYTILPAPNFPTSGACPDATFCFQAKVRATLKSNAAPVPSTLQNTTGGLGESELQTPGSSFTIPDVAATAQVVTGTPALSVDKTPNSRIGPGDTAPFSVVTTNSGTNAVHDPIVADPLPSGLTFDPVMPGAPIGQSYTLSYVLPVGATPPGTVTFHAVYGSPSSPPVAGCTDVNRVCRLEWHFPGWALPPGAKIVIGYNVRLSPGVLAGTTITNTAGATGSNPDLRCDTATSVHGNANYGSPALYCTDSAVVTTLAGDNFTGEKWIAADPGLGWLDASGLPVAVGAANCPKYVDAGIVYTRFPCTARVLPGHAIDYLVRGVNSGTNPAKQLVIVDGLPAPGDTGVLLSNQARATAWNHRPTMLTPVAPVGDYAQVVTNYTDTKFPSAGFCTSNLRPPPGDTCPATAFDAAFGATNTGFRTVLTYPDSDLLAPGAAFALRWQMQAPATIADAASEPIAWNSFAYRPTFVASGSKLVTLPATEPLKVGVSMPLGAFSVTKAVVGLPAGVSLGAFSVAYDCTVTMADGSTVTVSQGTFTLTDAATWTSARQPQGAVCRVWETDAQGGDSSNLGVANAASITIDSSTGPQSVTLTNSYASGSLVLSKAVTWDAVPPIALPGPFEFDVSCAFPNPGNVLPGFPLQVSLHDTETTTISDIPAGAVCVVTETNRQGAMETHWTPSNDVVSEGDSATVTIDPDSVGGTTLAVDNVYTTGAVEITKELTGDSSLWAQGPFAITVSCVDPGGILAPVVQHLTLTPAQLSATVSPIPTGYECTTTETDPGDAASFSISPSGVVTIPPYTSVSPGPMQVVVSNHYATGSITIAKVLTGDAAGPMTNARFTIDLHCERDLVGGGVEEFLHETYALRGGEQVTSPTALPIGARCWAVETNSVGATSVAIDHDVAHKVTITDGVPDVTITATNTYDGGGEIITGETGLRIEKVLAGPGAPWAHGPFVFETVCSLGGFTLPTYPHTILTTTDRVGFVNPIPAGARCRVSEIDDGNADGAVPRVISSVVVPASSAAAVGVTAVNTFSAGSLVVSKTVTGHARATDFGVSATCSWTPPGGAVTPLDLSSYRDGSFVPSDAAPTAAVFRLHDGEVKPMTVPLGATCAVHEFDAGGALRTTYTVAGGANPEAVVVQGDTEVHITNAFAGSGSLASTGGQIDRLLVVAGLLLAIGVVGWWFGRRRAVTA